MSDQERLNNGSLVPAGLNGLAPVAATNPLVSRGVADLSRLRFERLKALHAEVVASAKAVVASQDKARRLRYEAVQGFDTPVPHLESTQPTEPLGCAGEPPHLTSLTLWVKSRGGVATALIPRNAPIPTKKNWLLTTVADNQTSVAVEVFQGERPMPRDDRKIGQFYVDGILPAPRGVPQIEVIFDLDANGILHVSAKDLGTGKENKVRIDPLYDLSGVEIKKELRRAANSGIP
jgi:molecular chaperone DnaK (HSP70)